MGDNSQGTCSSILGKLWQVTQQRQPCAGSILPLLFTCVALVFNHIISCFFFILGHGSHSPWQHSAHEQQVNALFSSCCSEFTPWCMVWYLSTALATQIFVWDLHYHIGFFTESPFVSREHFPISQVGGEATRQDAEGHSQIPSPQLRRPRVRSLSSWY